MQISRCSARFLVKTEQDNGCVRIRQSNVSTYDPFISYWHERSEN